MARGFGNIATTEDLPFYEYYFHNNTSLAVASDTSVNLTLGSFTMPWAGRIMADLTACAQWTSTYENYTIHLNNSTPAPSLALNTAYSYRSGSSTAIDPMSLLVSWNSVPALTSVTVIMTFEGTTLSTASITRRTVACSVRLFPT
jgi:hypothetical protein